MSIKDAGLVHQEERTPAPNMDYNYRQEGHGDLACESQLCAAAAVASVDGLRRSIGQDEYLPVDNTERDGREKRRERGEELPKR